MQKLKSIITISILIFTLTSCANEYVSKEPARIESIRPNRPSELHIWVDGDWDYNRRNRLYSQNQGVWIIPRNGRKFVPGNWNHNHKGYYWRRNRWN